MLMLCLYLQILDEFLTRLSHHFILQLINTKTGLCIIPSCLYNLLSPEHMDCWCHSVLAHRLLHSPNLTISDITLADAFLFRFCYRTERMFGKEVITPNMHISCHLCECILDFGIQGQLPTNNWSVEVQMIKLYDTEIICPCPHRDKEDFKHLLSFHRGPVGTFIV